tara:strand:+ start:1499 stop:1672 length:174 start_codon:yes stop_codon:yes gene_type:complete
MSKTARWICAAICFFCSGFLYSTSNWFLGIPLIFAVILLLFSQRKPGSKDSDDMGLL